MHLSLHGTTTLFLLNVLVLLSLVPHPVASLPIMAFKRGAYRNTQASIPSYMNDQEHFDIVFTFAWLCALFGTWWWAVNRSSVSRRVARINWLALAPSTSIPRVLSFCVDTYRSVATLFTLGVNDVPGARTYLEASGGLSRPMASANRGPSAQGRPQRARVQVGNYSAPRGRATRVLGIGRDTRTRSTSPV
ncbi:hypothetical protein BC827DRAFT_1209348 [Russula dissimulans]|nr:hypothetical protein BC827DRAFT_1209348 [Russula dissimulans]